MKWPVYEGNEWSLGEGREVTTDGPCSASSDGKHHYVAVTCVQSVEHFICLCGDEFYD